MLRPYSIITALSATNLPPVTRLRSCATHARLSTPAWAVATSLLAPLGLKNSLNHIYQRAQNSIHSKVREKYRHLSATRATYHCILAIPYLCATAKPVNCVNALHTC